MLASIAGHHFISESPEAALAAGISGVTSLLITLLRWGTPESPRWLLRRAFCRSSRYRSSLFWPACFTGR